MLKIRLQGTKNDIRWFVRLLQRDKRFEVNNVSTFFDNVGTDKYKRVYAEVSRKKKDSGMYIDLCVDKLYTCTYLDTPKDAEDVENAVEEMQKQAGNQENKPVTKFCTTFYLS